MGAVTDLRGRTFGRLTISRHAEPVIRNGRACWPCSCECGNAKLVSSKNLIAGNTVSCGCWRADPNLRQGARMKVSPRRRRAIAKLGGAAFAARTKAEESK
jgi:hypothetical protein